MIQGCLSIIDRDRPCFEEDLANRNPLKTVTLDAFSLRFLASEKGNLFLEGVM